MERAVPPGSEAALSRHPARGWAQSLVPTRGPQPRTPPRRRDGHGSGGSFPPGVQQPKEPLAFLALGSAPAPSWMGKLLPVEHKAVEKAPSVEPAPLIPQQPGLWLQGSPRTGHQHPWVLLGTVSEPQRGQERGVRTWSGPRLGLGRTRVLSAALAPSLEDNIFLLVPGQEETQASH